MRLLILLGWFLPLAAIAQSTAITGTVTDSDDGTPLPGVSVVEKGTYNGSVTDLDGNYTLMVSSPEATITFTYIGYKTTDVALAGRTSVNHALAADIAGLEEAIVIGYGNQQRSKISGAVGTIDVKDATSVPVLRTEQALQGRAAGVQVTQNSGQPGSTQSIRIRGTGSLNNAEPLWVVDGIPTGGIDFLNPADIESISVLKDAASAAIYGARGGNGVILVTTKKGAKGQPAQVTYDAYYGFQEPWKKIGLLNAEQYAILMNESRASAGLVPYAQLADPASLGEGTDWQDALFQRAPIMNHSFNFTKGTATSSTAIGGSHFVQDGIIGGEKGRFERTTFRISSQQEAGDRFRIGQTVNFTHLNRNALAENNEFATPVVRALNMDPVTPVTRPDGSYAYSELIGSDIANPINQVATTHDTWTTNRFVGNLFGEYDVWQNLKVRSSINVDLSLGSQKIFFPTFDLGIGPNDPNRPAYEWREVNGLIRNENKWSNWQWENTATYDKDFDNGDRIQAIFGYSALYGNYQNIGTYRDSLNSNNPELAFLDNSLNFNEQAPNASGGFGESSYLSSFARIQYELGDRYSVSGTLRRDGSSKFGANNRFGIFPSLSAAWNLTEIPWVVEKDWIEFAKVRASWGRNGNADGIGNFDFTSVVFNGQNYTFGPEQVQVNGAGPVTTSNPDLKWETVEQFNAGVDLDLYRGRFNVVLDYFIKNTNDMLAVVPVPGVVGFLPAATNVASARNKGVELALTYRGEKGDWDYDINGNISVIRNEITGLGEGGQPLSTGGVFGTGNDFVAYTDIGLPMAIFYGYETAGIFQTDEEAASNAAQPNAMAGDVIFVDQNGDGAIDEDDKTVIGNPHPDFTYGITGNLKYKQFDLSLFVQGSHGNDLYNGIFRYDLNTTNLPVSALERWTGEGSTNEHPRISHLDANQNNRVSDRFIEDGSFLRIKNLQIGYSLPDRVVEKMNIGKFRCYLSASNLLTWTNYSGLDPEIGSRGTLEIGIDRGFYPVSRNFIAGINVTF